MVQVRLDCAHRELQFGGNLLVRGRLTRVRVTQHRPAECDEDAPLLWGDHRRLGALFGEHGWLERGRQGPVEYRNRAAEAYEIAAGEPRSCGDPLLVDKRPVRREPVIDNPPLPGATLEAGMEAGDSRVGEHDVRAGTPPDRPRPRVIEYEDLQRPCAGVRAPCEIGHGGAGSFDDALALDRRQAVRA